MQRKGICPREHTVFKPLTYYLLKRTDTGTYMCEGAQIPVASSPGRLILVRWLMIFVGSHYGAFIMSPFWCLEF
jgi:hypothetical protein